MPVTIVPSVFKEGTASFESSDGCFELFNVVVEVTVNRESEVGDGIFDLQIQKKPSSEANLQAEWGDVLAFKQLLVENSFFQGSFSVSGEDSNLMVDGKPAFTFNSTSEWLVFSGLNLIVESLQNR